MDVGVVCVSRSSRLWLRCGGCGPEDAAEEEYPDDGYDEDGAAIPGIGHARFLSLILNSILKRSRRHADAAVSQYFTSCAKDSGFRLAPPTRAPSIPG